MECFTLRFVFWRPLRKEVQQMLYELQCSTPSASFSSTKYLSSFIFLLHSLSLLSPLLSLLSPLLSLLRYLTFLLSSLFFHFSPLSLLATWSGRGSGKGRMSSEWEKREIPLFGDTKFLSSLSWTGRERGGCVYRRVSVVCISSVCGSMYVYQ